MFRRLIKNRILTNGEASIQRTVLFMIQMGMLWALSAAFFDINGLKKTYTHFGFEIGEKLIFECAVLLKSVFGKENVYHITGDEYNCYYG